MPEEGIFVTLQNMDALTGGKNTRPEVQPGEPNTRAPNDTFKHDGYDDAN